MRLPRPGWKAVSALAWAALLLAWGTVAAGEVDTDWPQWRGPTRDGISAESSGWPSGWPPRRLWGRNVGKGCTSPIIVSGKLYVMGWTGSRRGQGVDTVYCFDARTGRERWKVSYTCRYQGRVRTGDTRAYGGPSSTPTFDRDTGRLYTLSTDGDLRCWDAARRGKLLWAKNLYESYTVKQRPYVGGGRRDFGFPTAPLVLGDLLIIEVVPSTARSWRSTRRRAAAAGSRSTAGRPATPARPCP